MVAASPRSRRALLLGGAAGVGGALAAPLLLGRGDSLALHGAHVRVVHGNLSRPTSGDRALVTGTLLDAAGTPVGSMHADVAVLRSVDRSDHSPAALETHTLVLPNGTLVGTGVADHAGTGTFAITGGTGSFAATRGSYTLTQSRIGQGGDGSAHLTLTLED